jgi:hypothetical protein
MRPLPPYFVPYHSSIQKAGFSHLQLGNDQRCAAAMQSERMVLSPCTLDRSRQLCTGLLLGELCNKSGLRAIASATESSNRPPEI